MNPYLTLINLAISCINEAVKWLGNKQLIDAGKAEDIAVNLQEAMNETKRAIDARNAVRDDANSVQNDPDNRDNKK